MSTEEIPTTAHSQQQEVDQNYEAFKAGLPELLKNNAGRTALMRHGKVIACFDTGRDAIEAGRAMFKDGRFSIQKITKRPLDLGYFSRVGVLGTV